jgi:hypothetical protein
MIYTFTPLQAYLLHCKPIYSTASLFRPLMVLRKPPYCIKSTTQHSRLGSGTQKAVLWRRL